MIICIEGGDACGKQTQTTLLAEKLGGARFAFPNYTTPAGKAILAHLKRQWQAIGDLMERDPKDNTYDEKIDGVPLDPLVFQALQTVNRLELLPQIYEAVVRGPVVFDRYTLSGLVYGGLDGLDPKWVSLINDSLPKPNVWILLDVPVEEGWRRRPERRDRIESNRPYLEKIRVSYLRLFTVCREVDMQTELENRRQGGALTLPRWHVVDGVGTVAEVHERIMNALG